MFTTATATRGADMNLNIYTLALEYIGVIDTYSSLRWRRQLFDAGEIEIHCPANSNNLAIAVRVQTDDIIVIRDDRPAEFALFEGIKITEDADNVADITLTGRLGTAFLDRCVINRTYNLTGSAEASMRTLVTEQMPRILPSITLAAQGGFTQTITAQVSYKNLLSVLCAISKATGVLFNLSADIPSRIFVFETYEGTNRTVSQTANPRVVFNDLDETLSTPEYEFNSKNHKNYAFVGGEGEGSDRIFTSVDRTNGAPRRELFVDAKDIRQETLALTEYIALLKTRGGEKLDEATVSKNFESDIPSNCPYTYTEDYNIGDIVTTHKSAWGIMIDDRVTEIEEIYDTSTGETGSITPVFGSPLPEKFSL